MHRNWKQSRCLFKGLQFSSSISSIIQRLLSWPRIRIIILPLLLWKL